LTNILNISILVITDILSKEVQGVKQKTCLRIPLKNRKDKINGRKSKTDS